MSKKKKRQENGKVKTPTKQASHGYIWVITFGTLLTIAILINQISTSSNDNQPENVVNITTNQPDSPTKKLNIFLQKERNNASAYLQKKTSQEWWLENSVFNKQSIDKITKEQKNLTEIFNDVKNVNTLSKEIVDNFSNFKISIFENGISKIMTLKMEDAELTNEEFYAKFEICFVPENQMQYLFPKALHYKRDWGAIMLPAIKSQCPSFKIAVIMHELGHALYHKNKEPSSIAPPGTELYAQEEVIMYELEIDIIDFFVQGQYRTALKAVAAQKGQPANILELVSLITQEDYEYLDKMSGCEPTLLSKFEAGTILVTHELGVCFAYLELMYPPDQLVTIKNKIYLEIGKYIYAKK